MTIKHFLDIDRLDTATLRTILARATELRRTRERPLNGQTLAMIFEKPSTRTRVSFEVGMRQLGGETVVLTGTECQFGHGETIADTARVLSRFVDAIMIRTDYPVKVEELAEYASVPVINGLTHETHPCQIMADIQTYEDRYGAGSIEGKTVLWTGDGNNVCHSWIQAAARFGFELRIAGPEELRADARIIAWAREQGAAVLEGTDAMAMADGADIVVTDCWVSMGFEPGARHDLLRPYQVNEALMAKAKKDAMFMHCLPAHRGEEVVDAVIDGPNSVVWDEAENRMHVQKGILAWCLSV
ncbi:ornithine carbamoyltransferase [Novispirillum itersonii]|uniref:Ornithine carbamoyltransferase n=1 Tax=Novispirillum itersonii TaxID=189 RepID=A0A7W9ZID8_NOVIT|nr:ornithine carbamoyltransferase [Novispirillum itersonii]MBB6212020.1 ornithine carbamoyltransferase [Novispirillum itersonii]